MTQRPTTPTTPNHTSVRWKHAGSAVSAGGAVVDDWTLMNGEWGGAQAPPPETGIPGISRKSKRRPPVGRANARATAGSAGQSEGAALGPAAGPKVTVGTRHFPRHRITFVACPPGFRGRRPGGQWAWARKGRADKRVPPARRAAEPGQDWWRRRLACRVGPSGSEAPQCRHRPRAAGRPGPVCPVVTHLYPLLVAEPAQVWVPGCPPGTSPTSLGGWRRGTTWT
jgi:hypothetical protein